MFNPVMCKPPETIENFKAKLKLKNHRNYCNA